MRYLFFLVLLGNVIFYVWEWRTAALKPLLLPAKESITFEHKILLLSEIQPVQKTGKSQLQEQQVGRVQESPYTDQISPQDLENELVCFEVGPFDNKDQFLEWNEKNLIKAKNISFHLKDIEIVSGYLVYYPAAETTLQAEDNVAILESKGVDNLWLFKFGDMKGAISLGFYDTEARAKQIRKSLEKSGVDAKIKTHSKVKNHTFARIAWNKNEPEISKFIASYKKKFSDHEVEKLPECSILSNQDDN